MREKWTEPKSEKNFVHQFSLRRKKPNFGISLGLSHPPDRNSNRLKILKLEISGLKMVPHIFGTLEAWNLSATLVSLSSLSSDFHPQASSFPSSFLHPSIPCNHLRETWERRSRVVQVQIGEGGRKKSRREWPRSENSKIFWGIWENGGGAVREMVIGRNGEGNGEVDGEKPSELKCENGKRKRESDGSAQDESNTTQHSKNFCPTQGT